MLKLENFRNTTNAFNFIFKRTLNAGEIAYVKTPRVSANKRGVNDIGWMTNGDVTLYATVFPTSELTDALWQEIADNDEVNKTASAFKIVNNGGKCKICIRMLLN